VTSVALITAVTLLRPNASALRLVITDWSRLSPTLTVINDQRCDRSEQDIGDFRLSNGCVHSAALCPSFSSDLREPMIFRDRRGKRQDGKFRRSLLTGAGPGIDRGSAGTGSAAIYARSARDSSDKNADSIRNRKWRSSPLTQIVVPVASLRKLPSLNHTIEDSMRSALKAPSPIVIGSRLGAANAQTQRLPPLKTSNV
jgi:hypothetical protein